MNKVEFGSQLRMWRLVSGLSQKEVANQVGCNGSLLSLWEKGHLYPPQHMIDALCSLYEREPIVLEEEQTEEEEPSGLHQFLQNMKELYFYLEKRDWTHMADIIVEDTYINLPRQEDIELFKEGLKNVGFQEIVEQHYLYTYGFKCKKHLTSTEYFIEFLPFYGVILINQEEITNKVNGIQNQIAFVKHFFEEVFTK